MLASFSPRGHRCRSLALATKLKYIFSEIFPDLLHDSKTFCGQKCVKVDLTRGFLLRLILFALRGKGVKIACIKMKRVQHGSVFYCSVQAVVAPTIWNWISSSLHSTGRWLWFCELMKDKWGSIRQNHTPKIPNFTIKSHIHSCLSIYI
jgi:hypothetical protein